MYFGNCIIHCVSLVHLSMVHNIVHNLLVLNRHWIHSMGVSGDYPLLYFSRVFFSHIAQTPDTHVHVHHTLVYMTPCTNIPRIQGNAFLWTFCNSVPKCQLHDSINFFPFANTANSVECHTTMYHCCSLGHYCLFSSDLQYP